MTQLSTERPMVRSDDDGCYWVQLPDYPEQHYRTHGDSYEEAAKHGKEAFQLLLEDARKRQQSSPILTDSRILR